jgi:hypothetical protein
MLIDQVLNLTPFSLATTALHVPFKREGVHAQCNGRKGIAAFVLFYNLLEFFVHDNFVLNFYRQR